MNVSVKFRFFQRKLYQTKCEIRQKAQHSCYFQLLNYLWLLTFRNNQNILISIKTSLFIFMGPGALKINFVIGSQKNVVFFNLCHLLLTLVDLEVTWSIFLSTGQVFVCLQISILILGSKNQVEERRVLLSIKRTQSHDSLTLAPKSPTHLHLRTSKVSGKKWQEKIE